MDTLLKKVVHCTILSSLCVSVLTATANGQNGEIYIIEAGTDPDSAGGGPTSLNISSHLGEEIAFEIFVRQIGPEPLTPLRGIQVDFPCVAEGDISGSVAFVRKSVDVNESRPDWVFWQLGHTSIVIDSGHCPPSNVRVAASLNAGDRDITGLGPLYLYGFKLAVSADASGAFTVPLIGASGLGDIVSERIPVFLRTLILTVRPCGLISRGDVAGDGGSCGPDGDVTLVDTLAILDGFENQFAEGCDLVNIDIAGDADYGLCRPNGIIDLHDIIAVLDAFQGLDNCCAETG